MRFGNHAPRHDHQTRGRLVRSPAEMAAKVLSRFRKGQRLRGDWEDARKPRFCGKCSEPLPPGDRKSQLCPKCGYLNTPLRRNLGRALVPRMVVAESVVYALLVWLGVLIIASTFTFSSINLLLLFPLVPAFFAVERIFRRFRWKLPPDKKERDRAAKEKTETESETRSPSSDL